MKTHFITGGSGFIGSKLVTSLLRKGDVVYMLWRNSIVDSKYKKYLNKKTLFVIKGDIVKPNLGIDKKVLRMIVDRPIDIVWHLAANLDFNQDLNFQKKYLPNVVGTKNVINFANTNAKKIVFFSTAYVCGNKTIFLESDLDVNQKFRNDYEKTKFIAERNVRENSKIPYVILRPSLVIDNVLKRKASNCTFGYYRYAYMFFLFRHWLLLKGTSSIYRKVFVKLFGVSNKGKYIYFKRLFLPYPNKIYINMVPLDYVIRTSIKVAFAPKGANQTYNLTHPKPRPYIFLMKTMFEDLGFKNMHYLPVHAIVFRMMFYLLYIIAFSWRGYVKSALMYLPYVTTSPIFGRVNVNNYNKEPKVISKKFFSKINKKAFEDVFVQIN